MEKRLAEEIKERKKHGYLRDEPWVRKRALKLCEEMHPELLYIEDGEVSVGFSCWMFDKLFATTVEEHVVQNAKMISKGKTRTFFRKKLNPQWIR